MKRLILLVLVLALTLPTVNAQLTRNYLQESGALLPGYHYSLMFSADLWNLTSGTARYNNIQISYTRQNSFVMSDGTTDTAPFVVLSFYGIPLCTESIGFHFACASFVLVLSTNARPGSNDSMGGPMTGPPIPGVECCQAVVMFNQGPIPVLAMGGQVFVYLVTKE